jgi:hypothetical protein
VSAIDRVVVTCVKRHWVLRRATAYDWILAVSRDTEHLAGVFPGLIRAGDVEAMCAAMEMFDDMDRRWENVARAALTRASGREWWRALNLMKKLLGGWTTVNGAMLLSGCDARTMSLSSWLDAAVTHMVQNLDEDGVRRLEFELDKLPAGVRGKGTSVAVKRSLAAFAID